MLSCAAQAQAPGAAQGQQPGQPAARAPPAPQAPPATSLPDADFIEFLGEDDHGDAAWWEFLRKAAPGAQNSAPPPPRGPKES